MVDFKAAAERHPGVHIPNSHSLWKKKMFSQETLGSLNLIKPVVDLDFEV